MTLPAPIVGDPQSQLNFEQLIKLADSLQTQITAITAVLPGYGSSGVAQVQERFGTGTLTWPGASPFTNTLTLAHGMTRAGSAVTPTSAIGTGTLAAGSAPIVIMVVAIDATNVQWRGYAADGTSPAAATTKAFYWWAGG